MDDGARECRLYPLSLRETLRDAVSELAHLQELDELSGAGFALPAGQSVEGAKIQNILAGGQVGINPGAMRQHTDVLARLEGIAGDTHAIDDRVARVRTQ